MKYLITFLIVFLGTPGCPQPITPVKAIYTKRKAAFGGNQRDTVLAWPYYDGKRTWYIVVLHGDTIGKVAPASIHMIK